jgi:acyl carrier protein
MEATTSTLDQVKVLVVETLGITDRLDSIDASSGLLGAVPELDSMAVVELICAIESKFGMEVEDSEITIDMFETFGTLTAYVDANRT